MSDYQAAVPHRTAGLEDSRLIETQTSISPMADGVSTVTKNRS